MLGPHDMNEVQSEERDLAATEIALELDNHAASSRIRHGPVRA
ncbi:hypothetical protein [Rhodobacter sp. NTK016B]|nr:hypothetical protein [Rhodobacter sp. NTK016B]